MAICLPNAKQAIARARLSKLTGGHAAASFAEDTGVARHVGLD